MSCCGKNRSWSSVETWLGLGLGLLLWMGQRMMSKVGRCVDAIHKNIYSMRDFIEGSGL